MTRHDTTQGRTTIVVVILQHSTRETCGTQHHREASFLFFCLFLSLIVNDFESEERFIGMDNEHGNDLATAKANHGYGIYGFNGNGMTCSLFGKRRSLRSNRVGGFSSYLHFVRRKRKNVMIMVGIPNVCACVLTLGKRWIKRGPVLVTKKKIVNE